MKMIQNKNLIQKISLILLMILCFNFVCPVRVHAGDTIDLAEQIGGMLIEPISDLVLVIGDSLVQILHDVLIFDLAKENSNRWQYES